MNSSSGQFLGELEKEIMDVVWENPQKVTVRSVYKHLKKRRKIAYTTVMTIMNRLVDKGLLGRKKDGRAYLYKPAVSKDKFLTRISRQIIKNFVSSFGDIAIARFSQELEKIPAEKRRKLIKELKKANGNL